ncbi:MAG: CPBP family intramembrane glutamic endopeptidase [Bryobacteraceae bacterium]
MRLGLFVILTICGFFVFALTMTFVPILPVWANYAARAGFLIVFGALWRIARDGHRLSRFRPIYFAYFTDKGLNRLLKKAISPTNDRRGRLSRHAISIVYTASGTGLLACQSLFQQPVKLLGLTTQTPMGVAVAKFLQASLIVIGILAVTRLCGENLASLYIREGSLILGLSVGLITAAACLVLTLQQPAIRAIGAAKLMALAPGILLFVVPNAYMEELLFRGLFLGRYEPLIGKWLAIVSTALDFTLAHMQVAYAPNLWNFLLVTLGFSIAWGWLMQKTGSLWGSVLFHLGADLLIILPVFASFGAV